MSLDVTSWAFALEDIPIDFTGNGKDISPPLEWSPGPDGTVCYAVIMDDPDGPRGSWVHWVVWNIREARLHQEIPREALVETAMGPMLQGRNSFERLGYNGPCPPSGTHRYFFKVYALDAELDLPAGSTTKADLLAAMEGHILDEGELMVTYCRSRSLTYGKLTGPYLPLTRPPRL